MPKFTVSIPGGRVGHFLAGAAVASVIGGTAIAVTSNSFTYSEPKTGFYLISPMDLTPADDSVADNYGASPKGLGYGERDGQGCFDGAVHLPQGAKIASVTTYYASAKTNFHTRIRFYRKTLAEEGGDYLIIREITDNTGTKKSVQDIIPQSVSVIRNNVYIYSYGICLSTAPSGAADNFFGALITYRYSSAGD